jgi:hypothetical protein
MLFASKSSTTIWGRGAHSGSSPLCGGVLSVQAISWVLDSSQSRGLSRLVLISIANHADKFGREAFPATKTIAGEAGVSEREVRYCVAELVELGEVRVDYKASKYGTNIYAMAKMYPANCAASTRQAPGKENEETRHTLADESSLTVKREDAAARPVIPIEVLNQRLNDYYKKKYQTDEDGRKYLISPSSGERIYA